MQQNSSTGSKRCDHKKERLDQTLCPAKARTEKGELDDALKYHKEQVTKARFLSYATWTLQPAYIIAIMEVRREKVHYCQKLAHQANGTCQANVDTHRVKEVA
jgi:hypothetical protein